MIDRSTHGDHPNLQTILLQFPDDEIERRFMYEYGRSRISSDKWNWLIGFCLVVVVTSFAVVAEEGPDLPTCGVITMSALHGIAVFLIIKTKSFHLRTMVAVLARSLIDIFVVSGTIKWTKPGTSRGLVKYMIGTNGVISLIFESVWFSVPLKAAVILNSLCLIYFSYHMSPVACSLVLQHDGGQQLIGQMWARVRGICSMASWFGRVQVLSPAAFEAISKQPYLSCMSVTFLLQAVLGYMLPLVGIYILERKERLRFWALTVGKPLREVQAQAAVSLFHKCVAVAIGVLSTLSIWEATILYLYAHRLE